MSTIKIESQDVRWGYIGVIFRLGINIVLLPLLLFFLSEDEIGLWYVLQSINGIVNLLDFGFSPTLVRNMAYCWSGVKELSPMGIQEYSRNNAPNFLLMRKVIYVSRFIYLAIALTALLLMSTIGTYYIQYITRLNSGGTYIAVWWIFVISNFVNMYYGYFYALLTGCGAIAQANQAMVYARIVQIVVLIIFLALGYGIIGAVLSYACYSVSYRFYMKHAFEQIFNQEIKSRSPDYHLNRHDFLSIIIAIWPNAWKDGLVTFANFLTSQAVTIICSLYYSLSEAGSYGIALQIVNAAAAIASTMYQTYQPKMQEEFAAGNHNKTAELFSRSIVLYSLTYFLLMGGVFILGIPVLQFIKPGTVISKTMLLWLGIYMFLFQRHIIYAAFIANSNRLPYTKAYVISGALVIVLTVAVSQFIPQAGIYGLIYPQIIVQLSYNNWKWPLFVHKELHLTAFQFTRMGFLSLKEEVKHLWNRCKI